MNALSWHCIVAVGFCCVLGCNQAAVETGPSYADLVITYNAELEALDRLEAKREKLVTDFEAESLPKEEPKDGLSLDNLLQSAKDLKDKTGLEVTSDPREMLDQLAEKSGDAEKLAGDLVEGLLSKASAESEATPEEIAAAEERQLRHNEELESLDVEIEAQKQRVERARDARDAAEAKSQSTGN